MRFCLLTLLLGASAWAAEESEFSTETPRALIIAPATVAPDSLVTFSIEPTRHELIADQNVFAAERWGQDFLVTARLPLTDALSLREEWRSGLQSETVLGDAFAATYRDALSMLEKTAAELRASEAWRIAATVQQQWLATNSVPFAEIVTYGAETKFTPVKTTTLKLQAEWQVRTEQPAAPNEQDSCRLSLEQTLVPQLLSADAGVGLSALEAAAVSRNSGVTRKLDGSLKWTPAATTALILGGAFSTRDTAAVDEATRAYGLKLQQRIAAAARVELNANYTESAPAGIVTTDGAWALGANSEIGLARDVNAGLGVRYQLRDDAPAAFAPQDLSFTLSLKGQF